MLTHVASFVGCDSNSVGSVTLHTSIVGWVPVTEESQKTKYAVICKYRGHARIQKLDKRDSETGMSADSETVIRKLGQHDSETGPARIPKLDKHDSETGMRVFWGRLGLESDLESWPEVLERRGCEVEAYSCM